MIHRVDDDQIDAIEVGRADGAADETWFAVTVTSIDDDAVRRIVEGFLSVRGDWDDLWMLARCVARRRSTSSDRRSVTFPSSRFGEPGRVYIADGTDEPVDVGEGAALRLIARWLESLVDSAPADVSSQDGWAEFVADVETIERDATSGPDDGSSAISDMTWTTDRDGAD